MRYEIIQNFINNNRSGKPLTPVGIVLHETDNYGDTDEGERTYFNGRYVGASAHAFIDEDSITQTIPFNEKAWHACEPANSMFIGIELCHATNQLSFDEIYKRAVWMFAYVFVNYLKITTVTLDNLMSHHEVSNKWHNTTHTDPTDYFNEYGKTVDGFRIDVQNEINKMIGVDKMKKVVTYFGDADAFSAIIVSQKYNCPLMKKADFDTSGLKADEEILIGGKPGSDRFTSLKDAANLV